MGDSEGKIEYTPDELAEIEKVLGGLPLDELPRGKPVGAALAVEEPMNLKQAAMRDWGKPMNLPASRKRGPCPHVPRTSMRWSMSRTS